MWAIFFEILAVIFGTIALFLPKILNPKIKFTDSQVSHFQDLNNCGKIFRITLFLCFLFNTIALYFYIGTIGLLFAINLVAVIVGYKPKIHLLTAFTAFLLYSLSSVIYNPNLIINYLPLVGFLYAAFTFCFKRANSIGIAFLTYSAAILMLVNILVVR